MIQHTPSIHTSSLKEKEWITDRLMDFNRTHLSVSEQDYLIPLNFHIKHTDNMVIAGINAQAIARSSVFVSILWVDKNHRRQDYGSYLLNYVESEAKKLGVAIIHLETFDFQARGFYLKRGYSEFATLENSPAKGHKRFYFTKVLV